MEAVPRMPMIWLDLKEAGEFQFSPTVKQFILKNYGEDPDNYNEQLKKLEQLRQSAVNVTRDFEGCSTLRKYFGQLHYLQSRVPLGLGQEAAVPISWTEIFSGKTVTHEDICYEQACILYNLGALHSMLGAMDNRVSEEGMKVSCTHFQCSAGAFTYLRDHFSHNFSVDMSHQILNLNINLMLGQAQECLLEKSMLDNRKSFLVARISAQVVDYYKEACRALENSETASMLGKIQKDWKKLVQMKIYYFAAVAHLHMGKQAEEQQKYGERVAYLQSSIDKLNEAIKLAKGQPDSVQEALRFTMDVIGGKFNSAQKDNDFIYHESVPPLETLTSVKGAPLVKALPVNPTDPSVTGPDIFAKLVPMAAHEASSLYSEEKAKLLRDVVAKIDSKNETLEQFMDSLGLDPESVDNMEMYNTLPSVLMEKCAALSVRPDTVKNLIQSMQVLSGVFTDVEASLREIRDVLDEDEAEEQSLEEAAGKQAVPERPSALAELRRDLEKYFEAHEKASFTNTELHRAMNLHISNLRLLGGPLDTLREALPKPQLSEDEMAGLQTMKRILGKVQEMRDQRSSLEKQLRDLIQQDDITTSLVTTEHADMKKLFEEQLKKYEQVKVYIDQNLTAQENILKALTEANVQYATVRKGLAETEHKWNSTVQMLVASYEAYEDLMKKSQEGKEFYEDLETKASRLLEKAKTVCKARKEERQAIMEKELKKKAPQRPTAPKPPPKKGQSLDPANLNDPELAEPSAAFLALGGDLPEELRSLPPELSIPPSGHHAALSGATASSILRWPGVNSALFYTQHRFPPNLPSPEVLAQISCFPTPPLSQSFSHSLHQPPLAQQQFPQLPNPQVLPPPSVSGYCPPSSQNQPGPPITPVRPSTTTVDSVQTPIPSYSPASVQAVMHPPGRHQPMPPVSSVYAAPPQMTPHVQYMQQPVVPISQPPQAMPAHHPQPQPQPQQVFAQPQPFYPPVPTQQQMPRPLPGPQPQFPQYMAQVRQPGPPNFHQPQIQGQFRAPATHVQPHQGYPSVSFVPKSQPPQVNTVTLGQMPHPGMPPQMPPSSQPVPSVSMPHLAHVNQQMPPSSQPVLSVSMSHLAHVNQQIPPASQPQTPPFSQLPGPPHPQIPPPSHHLGPAPHMQIPSASKQMPPPQQPQMLAPSIHMSPSSHPQMPSVSQPLSHCPQSQIIPSHQPNQQPAYPAVPLRATVPVQPQVPHGPLSSQIQIHPSNPSQHQNHPHPQILPQSCPPALPHNIYKPQPTIPPSSAPLSFPGVVPMVSKQSVAALQPKSQPPTSQPLAPQQLPPGGPISYAVPQGGNIPSGPMQHPVAAAPPGPQSMIPPSSGAPGAPQPHVLPSPAPSPSPSPGPPSLGMVTQRPSPALTPVGGATLPQSSVQAPTPTGPMTPSESTLFQQQNSSTDDLLSSSPESQHGGTKDTANVLLPTKADPQEEHHRKKAEGVRLIQGDPYQAPERVSKLSAQLERFRSTVQSLERPTWEGGLSKLDAQWKELQEQQEKDTRQLSIAIARCYTMKNRHQDVMPYDCNRVVLHSGKDDYINASFIEDLSPYCPRLIATQAPLTGTAADFWLMVYEQKVSVIVMLVSELELEKQKVLRYFPSERGQQLAQGPITLTLTTQKSTPTHIARMIGLQYQDQSLKRTVIHLQFTSWPELGLPESKSNLIHFIQEVHGHYLLQRPLHTPVVVHCSSGVGRTGAFCLLYAALQEIEAGNGIPDLIQLVRKMRQQRKNMLQEKLHLKFCYEAVLKHTEQVLQRHGIITSPCTRTSNNIALKSYPRQESQDIVLGGDMPISSIQATVAKLSIRPPSVDHEQESGQDQIPSVSEAASTVEPDPTELSLQPSQDPLCYEAMPGSISPPLSCTSSPGKTQSPSPPSGQGNGFTGSTPASPVSNHQPSTEVAPHAPSPPTSSSLDLLASLTPEAFTLDSAHRGKQRISKQSFLQPQEGKGLQGPPEGDDPLSSLDPLWTLNKS
ncbi:tyrosine-protein phosphatase non-receptor type 23-like isoform X2 [Sinocyclocheilus anshuiensis]|uniref:tyrosine-protein phosphatase non-receptor type 23-like isoform X2 n=1 Tax=Sinocyclocheilus anshuiensis TaxID=1608454 RepID=UPI0007B7CA21|nr:PREDICTED: tyrosine-protein phosphatase non-receptor type 23-like isoform X2 [Sinocyclocheilus anshuiensis]